MIDLEKLAAESGMEVDCLHMGSGSCVYSFGCEGVTQEHLERFAKAVAQRCVDICKEQQDMPECPERATYCAQAIAAEFGLDQTGEPS